MEMNQNVARLMEQYLVACIRMKELISKNLVVIIQDNNSLGEADNNLVVNF
jgi:hypothetical protein